MSNDNDNDDDEIVVDTLIVGAGVSGAVALHHLAQQQQPPKEDDASSLSRTAVLLVEAGDTAGGRTCTECIAIGDNKEYPVDTGGQWLGRDQTCLLQLVQELGLKCEAQSFPTTSDGDTNALIEMAYYKLPPLSSQAQEEIAAFEAYLQECYQTILLAIEQKSNNNNKQDDSNILLLNTCWDRQSVATVIDAHCTQAQAREQWRYLVQTVLAVNADDCSFLFFLYYVYVWSGVGKAGMTALGDGPDGLQALKVSGGTQQITQLLIDRAVRTSSSSSSSAVQVKYNCRIVHIDYTELVKNNSKGMIRARTANGSTICCRNVILALSPTLLGNHISFQPPLEKERSQLYQHMITGSAVKVILVFEQAFWRNSYNSNPGAEEGIANNNNKSIGNVGLVSNIFETTVGPYPALIGLITGRHAQSYHNIPNDGDLKQQVVLTQIHEMYCKGETNNNLPQPLALISKDWSLDEQPTGGCFCAVVPPSKDALFGHWAHLLQQPVVPGRIVLAGTESSTAFYGYMEGAARAGARAAQQVRQA